MVLSMYKSVHWRILSIRYISSSVFFITLEQKKNYAFSVARMIYSFLKLSFEVMSTVNSILDLKPICNNGGSSEYDFDKEIWYCDCLNQYTGKYCETGNFMTNAGLSSMFENFCCKFLYYLAAATTFSSRKSFMGIVMLCVP